MVEQLESRLVPVVGAFGLAPEVGRGGVLDGIVLVEQGSSYGTGTLLSDGRHILTAAHVIDGSGGTKRITFHLTHNGSDIDITLNLPSGSSLVPPGWVPGGAADQGGDLGLLTLIDQVEQQLDRQLVAPFGAQRFGFWDGDVLGEVVTMVGYGRTGTGAEGNYVDEVQRVTYLGAPGGTFRLKFKGQTTAPIASNATREQVQSALGALSTIGGSNVEVSDRDLPAGTWEVRFLRGLGNLNVETMTGIGASVAEVFSGGNPEMQRVKREGRNTIDSVEGQSLNYDFDDGADSHNTWGGGGLGGSEAGMERGDSGSPLLIEVGGGYAIAGVFSYITTGGVKDYNNYPTPDGSFGGTGTYTGTKANSGFLSSGLGGDYDLVLDMEQQVLGLDGVVEGLTIRAWRDGDDLVLSVHGSGDWAFNGEYYRAPINGPGGRIRSLTIRGTEDNETFIVEGTLGLDSVTIDGRAGDDVLDMENSLKNTWKVDGANSGTVTTNSVKFKNIETLIGGIGEDVVSFAGGGSVTGSVYGGGGYNTLDYSGASGGVQTTISPIPYGGGDGTIWIDPLPLDYTFVGKSTGIGGYFYGFSAEKGSGGTDTLKYESGSTWWALSGKDAGNVNGFAFTSMENLTGDRWNDRWVFGPGSSVSGRVDGGDSIDTLDYTAYGQAVTVDLKSGRAPAVGSYVNIEGFVGSTATTDTLIGADLLTSTWDLTGPNQGMYNGLFSYLGFENLIGGSGRDRFVFGSGGFVSGTLDGGAGSDWLDYRGFGQGTNVDLSRHFAAGTGGVWGIENSWGYLGGVSRLIGDALNNILVAFNSGNYVHGLGGRDLLIGGMGRNTVIGGAGDDIGIGGATTYDDNAAALDALMAEWARNIGYYARVANLRNGWGLTGGLKLDFGGTITAPPPIRQGGSESIAPRAGFTGRPIVMVPQTKVYGNGGYDFFVVRFAMAMGDFDRARERYL